MRERYLTHSEQETAGVAATLARRLPPGTVVLLYGELGAGKTAFVRGFVEGVGIAPDEVSSADISKLKKDVNDAARRKDARKLAGLIKRMAKMDDRRIVPLLLEVAIKIPPDARPGISIPMNLLALSEDGVLAGGVTVIFNIEEGQ